MGKEYSVRVTQEVSVTLKSEAFTDEFMAEFRESFYNFVTVEEHASHIGQLVARGIIGEIWSDMNAGQFVEGYGPIGNFVSRAAITMRRIDDEALEPQP